MPNCIPVERLSQMRDDSTILETNSIPGSGNGPTMRYYLRLYSTIYAQQLPNFTLKIFVEDYDGVDAVIMMYSQENGDIDSDTNSRRTLEVGDWQNATMDHKSDSWYETAIPISNVSEPYSWCFYYVRYAANDTLGNWEVSPLCNYSFMYYPITADWFGIELYDTPDLWYVVGTTNHTVTWSIEDYHGQSGWPYSLYEDGYLIELWSWPGNLVINVDGLELGDHTFELYLQVVFAHKASDTVVVHVVETPEEIPAGASTISVGPLTESGNATSDLSIPIIVTGLVIAAVIIIWKKRKT
jgi:hypothetical protein